MSLSYESRILYSQKFLQKNSRLVFNSFHAAHFKMHFIYSQQNFEQQVFRKEMISNEIHKGNIQVPKKMKKLRTSHNPCVQDELLKGIRLGKASFNFPPPLF